MLGVANDLKRERIRLFESAHWVLAWHGDELS
jgi:hypothetical protein